MNATQNDIRTLTQDEIDDVGGARTANLGFGITFSTYKLGEFSCAEVAVQYSDGSRSVAGQCG